MIDSIDEIPTGFPPTFFVVSLQYIAFSSFDTRRVASLVEEGGQVSQAEVSRHPEILMELLYVKKQHASEHAYFTCLLSSLKKVLFDYFFDPVKAVVIPKPIYTKPAK